MPRNKQPLAHWLITLVCLTMLMCIVQRAAAPLLKFYQPVVSASIALEAVDAVLSDSLPAAGSDDESGCTKNQKLLSYLQDHLQSQPALLFILLFLLVPLLQFLSPAYRHSPPISCHERRLHLRLCNFRE